MTLPNQENDAIELEKVDEPVSKIRMKFALPVFIVVVVAVFVSTNFSGKSSIKVSNVLATYPLAYNPIALSGANDGTFVDALIKDSNGDSNSVRITEQGTDQSVPLPGDSVVNAEVSMGVNLVGIGGIESGALVRIRQAKTKSLPLPGPVLDIARKDENTVLVLYRNSNSTALALSSVDVRTMSIVSLFPLPSGVKHIEVLPDGSIIFLSEDCRLSQLSNDGKVGELTQVTVGETCKDFSYHAGLSKILVLKSAATSSNVAIVNQSTFVTEGVVAAPGNAVALGSLGSDRAVVATSDPITNVANATLISIR